MERLKSSVKSFWQSYKMEIVGRREALQNKLDLTVEKPGDWARGKGDAQ